MKFNAVYERGHYKGVNQNWAMVSILIYVTIVSYLTYLSVPPILPLLTKDFGISYAEAGFLVTAGTIPCVIFSILGGIFSDKFGLRAVGVFSLFVLSVGSLMMAFAPSYLVVLISRFIIGVGAAVIPVITFSMIAISFSRREVGKLIGLRSISAPIASTISFPMFSSIGTIYGWRYCFYSTTFMGAISLVLFLIITKRAHRKLKKEHGGNLSFQILLKQVFSNAELWKLGMTWCFTCIALNVIWVWGPTIFVNFKGVNLIQASLISTFCMVMHIPTGPFFGWISGRYKLRKMILTVGLIVATIIYPLIILVNGLELTFVSIGIGIASSPIPILTYVLTPEVVNKNAVATGYGFILSVYNLGNAVAPLVIGMIYDLTQSLQIGSSNFHDCGLNYHTNTKGEMTCLTQRPQFQI